MVQPQIAVGPLQGQNVQRVLHHADLVLVTLRIGADIAGTGVGQVLALLAEHDFLLDRLNGFRQVVSLLLRQADDVVGQALGAFGPNPGQPVQLLDQPGQGRSRGGDIIEFVWGHTDACGKRARILSLLSLESRAKPSPSRRRLGKSPSVPLFKRGI